MRKYYRIPLIFFFLAAILGLFLRWQFVSPTPGIHYTFFMHSHSHIMFLGWIFNVLYLAFVEYHLPEQERKNYLTLFMVLQVLVTAMMISFPIQGYGLYSIIFSTLHTLAVIGFVPVFFRQTRGKRKASLWFARTSLIFLLISTAGPFSLGYLMANDMGQTVWYNFSIYFYLHFQYNGFFFFGVASLFFQLLERKGILFPYERARSIGSWMAVACVPAYALSLLFAKPGAAFNIMGAVAAVIQIAALVVFTKEMIRLSPSLQKGFTPLTKRIFLLVFVSLLSKFFLQLLSAHQDIAQLGYELRPLIIAYLHLVLVGVITFFVTAWYIEMQMVKIRGAGIALSLLVVGFIGSETGLAISPWWSKLIGVDPSAAVVIFAFSILMVAGVGAFALAFRRQEQSSEEISRV